MPFQAWHLAAIKAQQAQRYMAPLLDLEMAEALEAHESFTALLDGQPIGAAGIAIEGGHAIAWAVLAEDAGRSMVTVVRSMARGLRLHQGSVHSCCRADFPAGHRMLAMLGFQRSGGQISDPFGVLHDLYVRE